MATINYVRVDYRLIHGQVIAKWIKVHPINKIIIIDEELAKDDFMLKIYENAAPPGVKVKIYDMEKALRLWNKNQFGEGSVMILLRNIMVGKEAVEKGIPLTKIQIGGAPNKGGKKNIVTAVSLDQNEIDACKALTDRGVDVYVQLLPEDPVIDFSEITKRFYA